MKNFHTTDDDSLEISQSLWAQKLQQWSVPVPGVALPKNNLYNHLQLNSENAHLNK